LRVGITGHRGLAPDTTRLVTEALGNTLDQLPPPLTGVTLLADGPDSIFAEEILHRGGRLEVIIPATAYRNGLPADHHARYDQLLEQASHVERLPYADSTEEAHMAGSQAMLERIDELLAVWDRRPARGYGGTADVVRAAEERHIPVTIIWPPGASRD
jgi:hypothetical protein